MYRVSTGCVSRLIIFISMDLDLVSTALLELKVIIGTLIKRFTFELPNEDFEVSGKFFASLLPLVKGEEEKGAYLPLRIKVYEGEGA